MDATTLGNRWTILTISVVVRSCAIPVAWKVLPGQQEGSWRPYWEELLMGLQEAVPPEWEVLVLADRGLYARWLWETIQACGWHPFLRINLAVKARLVGETTVEWISRWVPTPGTSWQGEVECFAGKNSRVTGTLLMHWEAGYESAWIILTDLKPQEALVSWYGLRTWIEGGFKDFKRGRMADGITAKCGMPAMSSGSGWPWRWLSCGVSVWGAKRRFSKRSWYSTTSLGPPCRSGIVRANDAHVLPVSFPLAD